MDKIYVVFWTQGGNTQAMAEAIGEGIREAGKEAEVVFVTGADIEALKAAPKFALGCPAMGAEVLEEDGTLCMRCRRLCFREKDCAVRFLRMGRR